MSKNKRDYFDIISHLVLGAFKRKIKTGITHTIDDVKDNIKDALLDLKKNIFRSTIELILLTSGLAALIIGLMILATEYLPLYYILISYGVIISFVVLLTAKLK